MHASLRPGRIERTDAVSTLGDVDVVDRGCLLSSSAGMYSKGTCRHKDFLLRWPDLLIAQALHSSPDTGQSTLPAHVVSHSDSRL